MRIQREQSNSHQRLVNYEPLVVYGKEKKRDGLVIYHQREAPSLIMGFGADDGPSEGTGPPDTG